MVATGLALMFGVVRLVNFAHGEFYMLGGYAFWFAYRELGAPYPVAGLAAVAAMGAFGLAYERGVIRAILARTWHVQLIATLATSITLTNLAILDRKSTRLNSSHLGISYAVFCLKKKKNRT